VIAKEDYDTALSNKNQAARSGDLGPGRCQCDETESRITRVTSPIDGRIGRQLVNIGPFCTDHWQYVFGSEPSPPNRVVSSWPMQEIYAVANR
jgi:hypothetical protein